MLIFDITTVNSLINITYLTDSFRVALNDSLFKIIHIMPDPAVQLLPEKLFYLSSMHTSMQGVKQTTE